jgi:hypothetical protein
MSRYDARGSVHAIASARVSPSAESQCDICDDQVWLRHSCLPWVRTAPDGHTDNTRTLDIHQADTYVHAGIHTRARVLKIEENHRYSVVMSRP